MKPDYDAIAARWFPPGSPTVFRDEPDARCQCRSCGKRDIRALLTRALLLEAVYEAAKGIDYSEDLDDALRELAALDAASVVVES